MNSHFGPSWFWLKAPIGFITMPDGRRVAIVVFARGGRDRQPVIAEVSRAIYDYFADSARNALALFMQMR